ncbi:MAG TPA: hypothetical protein VGB46_11105 [Flavisolibacter sp.]|jgi:hypothetical protein
MKETNIDVPQGPADEKNTAQDEPRQAEGNQCGAKCPSNSDSHRGACYLDFGHGGDHKCSVDGVTW